jgi:hypothetical protein
MLKTHFITHYWKYTVGGLFGANGLIVFVALKLMAGGDQGVDIATFPKSPDAGDFTQFYAAIAADDKAKEEEAVVFAAAQLAKSLAPENGPTSRPEFSQKESAKAPVATAKPQEIAVPAPQIIIQQPIVEPFVNQPEFSPTTRPTVKAVPVVKEAIKAPQPKAVVTPPPTPAPIKAVPQPTPVPTPTPTPSPLPEPKKTVIVPPVVEVDPKVEPIVLPIPTDPVESIAEKPVVDPIAPKPGVPNQDTVEGTIQPPSVVPDNQEPVKTPLPIIDEPVATPTPLIIQVTPPTTIGSNPDQSPKTDSQL